MVLNGLGCIQQALSLVPRFFPHTPTERLMSPRVAPAQLHDDARGRTLETLYASGVTALYRLLAATAAERLGLAPRLTPRDRTSFPVEGRDHRDAAPAEHVVPITTGDSREHRPALRHVRRALSVAHQAGLPVLMKPLRGNRRDGKACGSIVHAPMAPWPTPSGPTYRVAARALSRDDNRPTRAETHLPWSPRVPAT
jgi:transposase